MTPIATVGGPARMGSPASDPVPTGPARLVYGRSVPRGRVYHLKLAASARLTAIIEPTEDGFVARCVELGSLGNGSDREAALEHLLETTSEYLAFLEEEKPPLADEIAHHAMYVPLVGIPVEAWFVAVTELARSASDAS